LNVPTLTRFDDHNCSVAQALDVLGDRWTLLIIRESFFGTRRFVDFQKNLGIAKNILSRRLETLVEHGVLQRIDEGQHGARYEYRLSPKGKDLITVLTALRQWGDRWIFGEGNEPVLIVDRRTEQPIPRLAIRDEGGQLMSGRDLQMRPGPGAAATTLERFKRLAERR
jgi:DNA-binding HxlR family transcriptional regulator